MKRFALVLACMLAIAPLAAHAAPIGGTTAGLDYALGGGETTYQMAFIGGESTGVFVAGDGSTVLDVAIYDAFGNLVAANLGNLSGCTVVWTPAYSGNYTVVVVNEGSATNVFSIAIV